MARRVVRASPGVSRLLRTGGGMLALAFKNPAHQRIVYGIGEQLGTALEEGLGFIDAPAKKRKQQAPTKPPKPPRGE